MVEIINMLMENPYGIVLVLVALFAECIRRSFVSNMEMLFLDKKEESQKFMSRVFVMLFLCLVMNYLLTFDIVFIGISSLCFLLCFCAQIIIVIIRQIFRWIHKNDKAEEVNKVVLNLRLFVILAASPIAIHFVVTERSYNSNLVIILFSIIETFTIYIRYVGVESKELEIELINYKDKESFFVYKKINDEYLLCGDAKTMKDADKIIPIEIKEIYSRKYFLRVKGEEEEQICEVKQKNSSKE